MAFVPSERPALRFADILENIDLIQVYAGGMDWPAFQADRMRRDAIERCLQRISEAAVKLGTRAEQLAPGPPWQAIRALGECAASCLRPGRTPTDVGDHHAGPSNAPRCCRSCEDQSGRRKQHCVWRNVTTTTGTPRIRLRNLRKRFGQKIVLDGIDLDIMPGTSMVVIGGSGSGKSVLLKCILGLLEPDSGSIEIDGADILRLSRREQEASRSRIGMLFQNGALFDSLPVWENVVFGLLAQRRLRRPEGPNRAAEFLSQVGLAATVGELYPAELSGGMQKRVALARAIAAQPDIMFFDEPTTGLDPIMGAVIDGLVVECVKQLGSTAVAITHDMASARRIGDAAAMIYQGRIIWSGPASGLMDSGNPIVDQFTHGRREGPIQMELRR